MPKLTSSQFDQSEKNRWMLKIKYRVPPSSHIKSSAPYPPPKENTIDLKKQDYIKMSPLIIAVDLRR